MNFGEAIAVMKAGIPIGRTGWNGKGMFLYYVPENMYAATTEVAKGRFGDRVPYRAYIAMKTVDNDVVPWVASQTDILAVDWIVAGDLVISKHDQLDTFGPSSMQEHIDVQKQVTNALRKRMDQAVKKPHWTQTAKGKKIMAARKRKG